MRHFAMGLLCALGLTANAATLDYTAAKDPNGLNVYSVTKDALKKLIGITLTPAPAAPARAKSWVWWQAPSTFS